MGVPCGAPERKSPARKASKLLPIEALRYE